MALNPSNSSNLEQLALKGLICVSLAVLECDMQKCSQTLTGYCQRWLQA